VVNLDFANRNLQRQTECREEEIPEQALHNIACANLGNTNSLNWGI
jgi:hypothetical protein